MTTNVNFRRAVLLFLTLNLVTGCLQYSKVDENLSPQQVLERNFQQSMHGVVLKGFFTTSEESSLTKEQYTIKKISKLAGNYWTLHARIQYGKLDVTLPVPVQIKWAGDTPVIILTDTTIPGLGTFTARVLFYNGHYVGVWQHGNHVGQHFGKISGMQNSS